MQKYTSKIDNISYFKYILAIAVITLLFALSFAFASSKDYGLKVISSDRNSLEISFRPELKNIETIITSDGKDAWQANFNLAEIAYDSEGSPQHYVLNEKVTVPGFDRFFLEEVNVSNLKVISGIVAPIPEYTMENELPRTSYFVNEQLYDKYITPEWVKLNYSGLARNRHLADLRITAGRYNPEKLQFEIPEEIRIKIRFEDFPHHINNLSNDKFDIPLSLNHFETASWKVTSNIPESKQRNSIQSINSITDGNWAKIKISEEGLYRISSSALSDLSFNVSEIDPNTIKIFGNGGKPLSETVSDALNNIMNEQAIKVETNGDGTLKSVLFYAAGTTGFEYNDEAFGHYINHYSKENYYLLTWGGSLGKRMSPMTVPQGQVVNQPTTYKHRIFYEEDIHNPFPIGSGRQFFGRTFFTITDEFIQKLHNLDRSEQITFKFSLAHRSNELGTFRISDASANNELMQNVIISPSSVKYQSAYRNKVSFDYPASKISNDDRISIQLNYSSTAGSAATGYFDYYEIHYPRYFVAIDNELKFFTESELNGITEFKINEFSSGEKYGFDITDPSNPQLLNNITQSVNSLFTFKVDLSEPSQFFITNKVKTPTLTKTELAGLRDISSGYDLIIVTHSNFIESANDFKSYRESNSDLSIIVVDIEKIFNEFNAGLPDVTAVRDFVAFAVHNWQTKPSYVLLWGDGHFDYRNLLTTKQNFIPPYESLDNGFSFDETTTTSYDDYFIRVIGNDAEADLAIGRITVDSPELGYTILNKIKHYENNSSKDFWRTFVTLVADDGLTSQGGTDHDEHTNKSETLASDYIPDDLQINKIYLVEYPTKYIPNGRRKPNVTDDLISTVNTVGTLILNWIGHGNPQVWSHEMILDRESTIPQFTNLDKLFFLTAATCDFGRFDMIESQSGAEEMFLSSIGGTIGVFSAARVVYSYPNAKINQFFYTNLMMRDSITGFYPRLGDVMFRVKAKYNQDNDEKFFLLGDPTLRLMIPQYRVNIDSINGLALNEITEDIKLKGLSRVTLSGSVYNPDNSSIDNTFNGTVVLSMLDGDTPVSVEDEYGSQFNFTKYGGALNRSSYKIENGRFFASFMIPKDISFSENNGRFFTFASDTSQNKYGKGASRSFMIEGIDTTLTDIDMIGPEIKIFIDSRKFEAGSIVRDNPMLIVDLFDEFGINSTGIGIGHRIEAWLDGNPNSIDLTDKFFTSLEDNRYGSAQHLLSGLTPGFHTVRVRAWDVFNNYAYGETSFKIASKNSDIELDDLSTYPNPFTEGVRIRFRHDINPSFDITLNIHTTDGKIVRSIHEKITTALYSDIYWDGLDSNGYKVPTGAYILTIIAESREGTGMISGSAALKVE